MHYLSSVQIFGMLFRGRYVLLSMSIFSIYTGLIYNDCFSLAFNMFGTAYPEGVNTPFPPSSTYVFGVDPVWFAKDNKLNFYNSLKMKMAVIFGGFFSTFAALIAFVAHLSPLS